MNRKRFIPLNSLSIRLWRFIMVKISPAFQLACKFSVNKMLRFFFPVHLHSAQHRGETNLCKSHQNLLCFEGVTIPEKNQVFLNFSVCCFFTWLLCLCSILYFQISSRYTKMTKELLHLTTLLSVHKCKPTIIPAICMQISFKCCPLTLKFAEKREKTRSESAFCQHVEGMMIMRLSPANMSKN